MKKQLSVFILCLILLFSAASICTAYSSMPIMSAPAHAETSSAITSYLDFSVVSGTIKFTSYSGRVLASGGPVVLRLNTNNFATESQAHLDGKATIAVYTKNNDYIDGINASGMVGMTYNRKTFLDGETYNDDLDWRVSFKCWTTNFGTGEGSTPPSTSGTNWDGDDLNGDGDMDDPTESPLWLPVIDFNDPVALIGGTTDNFELRALYSLDDSETDVNLHFPERAIHINSLPVYFAADFTEANLHPQVYKTKVRFLYQIQ